MRLLFLTLCFSILLGGCSGRIPEPVTYKYTQQNKMQASHHWEVLAKDLSNRINNQLIITDHIDASVYVKQTCGDESKPCAPLETSTFNEAFRDLLITNLVDYGVPTKKEIEEDTIEINYKVQIVRHNTDRVRSLQPGLMTSLSAAVMVLRNAPTNLIILATGVMTDIANTSFTANGHYEVIITTSMMTNNKYLFRASDIYYINDRDFWHYQDTMPQVKTIQLSSTQLKQSSVSVHQPASLPLSQKETRDQVSPIKDIEKVPGINTDI